MSPINDEDCLIQALAKDGSLVTRQIGCLAPLHLGGKQISRREY